MSGPEALGLWEHEVMRFLGHEVVDVWGTATSIFHLLQHLDGDVRTAMPDDALESHFWLTA